MSTNPTVTFDDAVACLVDLVWDPTDHGAKDRVLEQPVAVQRMLVAVLTELVSAFVKLIAEDGGIGHEDAIALLVGLVRRAVDLHQC